MAIEAQAIAERCFTIADQDVFANLCGDHNPMHMDPLAVRRTQAGAQVVHGVHALLWALDRMAALGVPVAGAVTLNVQFNKFLLLDRPAALHVRSIQPQRVQAQLIADGQPVVTVVLKFATVPSQRAPFVADPTIAGSKILALDFEDMPGRSGRLLPPAPHEAWSAVFPAAAAALGARAVSGLGQLSRLVGMVCPGLHSIFAKLEIDFEDNETDHLDYRVSTVDERFRMVRADINGLGLRGSIDAFVRWPPVVGPRMADLVKLVRANEFAGHRALIAGGSRGLGEITARILAAGGADVIVTYRRGRAEAEALADDIRATCGAGACHTLAFDALQPAAPQLAGVDANVLYWFATPQIFRQKTDAFSPELFSEFERIYVTALDEALDTLPRLRALFYPSSVALDQNQIGMAEYCRAKSHGEALCRDIAAARPELAVLIERLPRVLTDQTATIARVGNADPVQTLLPLLHQIQRSVAGTYPHADCGQSLPFR